ncbi:MAG: LamG domain-containing protein [Oscillatoriaceae cyanobacterium Prado104]|jgi:cyanobactin cluster PatC/TenC/TruC protein|nr:LamG domain-containing protein [Oscillatoriaceae cyanobacterium Prado104]
MANFQSVLKFSNASDIVEIPLATPVKPSRFTLSCWARVLGGQGSWRSPVCLRDTSSNNRYAFYAGTGNQWHFYLEGTSSDSIVASVVNLVTLNVWTHLATTYDGTKLTLYVNGNAVAQKDSVAPHTINRVEIGSVAGSYPFPGEVTEVCFWNCARTQAEIQQDMYRGLRGDEPDLLGYWPLSEGSGNTVADKTEKKNNGTIKGATWQQQIFFQPIQPTLQQKTNIESESVLVFDGKDDYVEFPGQCVPAGNEITVTFWVYGGSSLPKQTSILEAVEKSAVRMLNIHLPWSNGRVYFDCGSQTTCDRIEKDAPASEYKDKWTHWAFTKNVTTGEMKIYLNGELWHSEGNKKAAISQADKLAIGSHPSPALGNHYHGMMQELSIWSRALSPEEIKQNMNRRLVGNEPNLTGYWPLNEGTGTIVRDKTRRGNHGSINGATWQQQKFLQPAEASITTATWEEPIFLQAASEQRPFQSVLVLDGQDDCVEIPYTPTLNPDRFTASCWVKVQGGQGSTRSIIVSRDMNPPKGYVLNVGDNNNKWQFWIADGKGNWFGVVGSDVTLNSWTHIAATWDGSKLALYINGELAQEITGNYAPNTARPLRIGAGATEVNPTRFLPGQIADVSIWNRPLSQAEIKKQMDVRLAGNEPGLVGYWHLNEGAGTIATDKSTIAHHGVIKGGAVWNRQLFLRAETQVASIEKKTPLESKAALYFDGQDDCINLGKKPLFKVEKNLTLEAWVCTERNNQEWIGVFSNVYDTGATESGYCLCLDGKGGVEFGLTPSSTQRIIYLSSGANTLPLNEWHHVAGVYDGQQMRVYIDGVQKITQAVASPSISYNPENNLHIGGYKDDDEAYYFRGKISEVRLWNVARSPEEIQKNMSCRLTGNEPGLVGYWPLNEGSGNTVSDKTVKGNHGPISGATWTEPGPQLVVAKLSEAKPVDANQEKALAEQKAALEKALADKAAAEAKAAADAKAATDAKAAADKAIAEKQAAEKQAADAKAAADKATAEKQAAEKQAVDAKAAADKVTAEKQAAEKQAADAKAAADKVTAEKQAAEQAAAQQAAAAQKAAAEKAELEKALAEAKATADKAVAEAQAATATKLAAEAKAAADRAEAEAQIAEIQAATAKKVEKAEAEARAAEARAKAAEAAALALAVEEKAKEVKGETKDKVTGINADRAKSRLLKNSTGLEDYGYWWQQMLQQPQQESEGDGHNNRRGRIGRNRRGRIWS